MQNIIFCWIRVLTVDLEFIYIIYSLKFIYLIIIIIINYTFYNLQ